MSDAATLMSRWQAFLGSVQQRQLDLLQEVDAGVASLDSLYAQRTALGAIDDRMRQLQDRLYEVWDKARDQMAEVDDSGSLLEAAQALRDCAYLELEHRWEQFKAEFAVKLVETMRPQVMAIAQQPRPCRECSGPIAVPHPFRAETVKCPYCSAVNQLLLQPKVADWAASAPEALGSHASLGLRQEIARFTLASSRTPMTVAEEVTYLRQWSALEATRWKVYCEAHAAALGEPFDDGLYQSRMDTFRVNVLMKSQAWLQSIA